MGFQCSERLYGTFLDQLRLCYVVWSMYIESECIYRFRNAPVAPHDIPDLTYVCKIVGAMYRSDRNYCDTRSTLWLRILYLLGKCGIGSSGIVGIVVLKGIEDLRNLLILSLFIIGLSLGWAQSRISIGNISILRVGSSKCILQANDVSSGTCAGGRLYTP